MRLSCNGCRVLRKGCSESCSIRPCLQWIKSPDAQSNATVFLAKFYGRAGLLNLINAAAEDGLRPAVFRSLLYEACGRIVNPIYGSVGLLWSGKWHMCQAAVEAVLKGAPIVTVSDEDAAAAAHPLLHNHSNDNNKPAAYPDIRHVVVSRSDNTNKRKESTTTCGNSTKKKNKPTTNKLEHFYSDGDDHQQVDSDAEVASHVSQAEANHNQQQQQQEDDDDEEDQQQQQQHKADLGLDLTLGFAPTPAVPSHSDDSPRPRERHTLKNTRVSASWFPRIPVPLAYLF